MAPLSKPNRTRSEARNKKNNVTVQPPPFVIDLFAPRMTPLLRAGLGGLASALRFLLLEQNPAAPWPSPISLGGARAIVERRRVTIDWNGAQAGDVLQALFSAVFRTSSAGVVSLAGTFEPASPPGRAVSITLQEGLKRTFLQHGSSTKKVGDRHTAAEQIDDQQFLFAWQPYESFAHQDAWKQVLQSLRTGAVALAGWAYPGAAQKHVTFAETRSQYGAPEALSACFALVGCLSFDVRPGRLGALIIPEPCDLVEFAITRPRLTPRRPVDAFVASLGDAVLRIQLALRLDETATHSPGVGSTHGVLLKTLPWASQQKSRCRTLDVTAVSPSSLDTFDSLTRALPAMLRAKAASEDHDDRDDNYFVATSVLRAFVADNLAAGYRWYAGFATATTGGKKPRFIHYYRDHKRDNLGALYAGEKKGLLIMIEHLDEAEKALIGSVHTALRQRFGRIANDTEGLPTPTREKRFLDERERWRRAFAAAKTHEQVRATLANMWSLAGPNQELRHSWQEIIPLLRPKHWQATRDLALVALASYRGSSALEDGATEETLAEGEERP